MMLREVFAHPFPKALNRVEVRGISGEGDERETKLVSVLLHVSTTAMVGGAVPEYAFISTPLNPTLAE